MCHHCVERDNKDKRKRTIITIIAVVVILVAFGLVGRMERNIDMMPDGPMCTDVSAVTYCS